MGLASSLRLRLRAHLRHRHSESWDRFSLYLTEGDRHLRELEGFVIRIAMPKGNRAKTKLGFSKDLRAALRRQIWDKQKKELDSMFGQAVRRSRKSRRKGGGRSTKGQLEKIVRERLPIRMDYKGKTYRGVALPDGTVRYARKIYTSLSSAAGTIAKRRTNWLVLVEVPETVRRMGSDEGAAAVTAEILRWLVGRIGETSN